MDKRARQGAACATEGSLVYWLMGQSWRLASWMRASRATRKVAIAVLSGLLAAGCYQLPGDGPMMGPAAAGSTETLPYDVVELTPTTVRAYRAVDRTDRPSTTHTIPFGGRLTVGPGDALTVKIFEQADGGIFPPTHREGADLGIKRVNDDGIITLPFVGAVQVAGLELQEIERRIVAQIGNRARNPQVVVEFAADRSNTASVSGDVVEPGQVGLIEGVRTVVEAINRRGGLIEDLRPHHAEVVVRRSGKVILNAPFSELLAGGDIQIQKGDEIVVRTNERTFTAVGAVRQAGNYPISRPGMSLAEALGATFGLIDVRSDKTGVFVFRLVSDQDAARGERSKIFRLDFSQPQSVLVAQLFGIQPNDVLYVANAPLHEYNKVLVGAYRTIVTYGAVKGIIPGIDFLKR